MADSKRLPRMYGLICGPLPIIPSKKIQQIVEEKVKNKGDDKGRK